MSAQASNLNWFEPPREFHYKCTLGEVSVPDRVQATIEFGVRIIYALVPTNKVDKNKSTLLVQLIGESDENYLVDIPGEVENAGTTVRVAKALFGGT